MATSINNRYTNPQSTTHRLMQSMIDAGLDYSSLAHIHSLADILTEELEAHENLHMFVSNVRVHRDEAGEYRSANIEVSAYYFDDRMGIVFEQDGSIAFAGWADSENVKPFHRAFERWVDTLKA